ncbi:tyrosine type site-specific recombinase [Bacteroides sp. CAG:1060]|nr:tyrosine type site-specific recombinase [Bacteroides sp. CAG:1060]
MLNTLIMSQKHSYTTADYLPWDTMLNLTHRLYKDGKYRISLLVACGSFLGLRISDLLSLSWEQILCESFVLNEKKTGKHREIKVNASVQEHIKECYKALDIKDPHEKCFLNRYGDVVSIQRINVVLKEINVKYMLKDVQHFSTHSFRKTFGRKVVEMAGENCEMALIKLGEIFNHTSTSITRRYLGLRQQELREVYESLRF